MVKPNQESERGQRQILCRPASGGLQRINNAAGLPYIAQEFQEENSQPDLRPVRQGLRLLAPAMHSGLGR